MALRRLYLLIALMFFMFVSPVNGQAARFSGEALMNFCLTDESGKEYTPSGTVICQAYISGVLDYHRLLRSLGTAPSIDFCIPDKVGLNELQERVARYILKNRQAHGNFIASPAVSLALYEAYPCK